MWRCVSVCLWCADTNILYAECVIYAKIYIHVHYIMWCMSKCYRHRCAPNWILFVCWYWKFDIESFIIFNVQIVDDAAIFNAIYLPIKLYQLMVKTHARIECAECAFWLALVWCLLFVLLLFRELPPRHRYMSFFISLCIFFVCLSRGPWDNCNCGNCFHPTLWMK